MSVLDNRNYYLQPTKEGIFILLIRAREDEAQGASVMYDGRSNALFIRRPKETILLDYINPAIQKPLLASQEVAVMELDFVNEEVVRSYKVPIRTVEKVYVATHGTAFSVC